MNDLLEHQPSGPVLIVGGYGTVGTALTRLAAPCGPLSSRAEIRRAVPLWPKNITSLYGSGILTTRRRSPPRRGPSSARSTIPMTGFCAVPSVRESPTWTSPAGPAALAGQPRRPRCSTRPRRCCRAPHQGCAAGHSGTVHLPDDPRGEDSRHPHRLQFQRINYGAPGGEGGGTIPVGPRREVGIDEAISPVLAGQWRHRAHPG